MLAEIEYGVRTIAWMQSEDGEKGRNRPERIKSPRPANEQAEADAKQSAKARAWARRQQDRQV